MPRYRLRIEYDGTAFCGWQRQSQGLSVQAAIEAALARASGQKVAVTGAGRTDAGVHAAGQCAHLDLAQAWQPERLAGALNAHLRPHAVAVLEVHTVVDEFHARFDAVRRLYRYTILNRRAPPALDANRVWHLPVTLDAEHMHEAGQALVGRHDFTSYRSRECQAKSPLRTLDRLHVTRRGEQILVELAARSFLHHQVRNIVGTLKAVGEGRSPLDMPALVLAARDRTVAGPTAPAAGLCLLRVDYPSDGRDGLRR